MWAIVPIKTFDRAKQRLANVLSEEERRSLMLAMARDVLTSLTSSTQLSGILIVSRAAEADALAQSFGTERYAESPGTTLAQALEQAAQHLIAHFDATGVVIVPADVPGIRTDELDQLVPVIAVSPIVGGIAIKGPAAKMMAELNMPATATAIAQHYHGLIDGFVLDDTDVDEAAGIEVKTLVTNTIMDSLQKRIDLAHECIAFLRSVSP